MKSIFVRTFVLEALVINFVFFEQITNFLRGCFIQIKLDAAVSMQ